MLPLRMLGIILLLFSLCDADSSCPEELNPLSLDPPEIIAEYGTQVMVNCTGTVAEHEGMYWIVNNKTLNTEEDEFFIPQGVLLSDWNVTAECKIQLNESLECSKELEMTIYKNPEVISSLKVVQVTPRETQYEMTCDTINVAPVQKLTVRWNKNKQLTKTNTFNDTTKTPVNESSAHTFSISREEGDVRIECEARLDFGPHGPQTTSISHAHLVSAQYAPVLNGKDTDYHVAHKDDDITLNCDAEGNPPPVFHWSRDGVAISESSNNLNITQINANTTYTCRASNYLGNTTKQIHVRVIQKEEAPAAPPTSEATTPRADECPITLTPSEIVVRFGDPALVNCSTSVKGDLRMGWEATVGGTSSGPPPAVTWMVEKLEVWDEVPSCYITLGTNFLRQCEKSPTITLYKTPDTVSVSAEHPGPMLEGTNYHLNCSIDNVAPVGKLEVKWYCDNEIIQKETVNDTNVTPQNVFSLLTITPERKYNGSLFRCVAELHLGPFGPELVPTETSAPYTAIVHYAPMLNGQHAENLVADKDDDITLNCDAEGNPPPVFHWSRDGVAISESSNNLNITQINASTTYTCRASNYLGSTAKQIHVRLIQKEEAPAAPPTSEATTPRADECPITLTPSEIVVRFGDPALVNCSTSAMDALGLGWNASVGGTSSGPPPAVTWMVEKLEVWDKVPSCYITLDTDFHRQCEKSPTVTLYKTPDTVSVAAEHPGPMLEGTNYDLNCDIRNVAPAGKLEVKWYRDNEIMKKETFNNTNVTPDSVFSSFTITPDRQYNGSLFRCVAELHLGPFGPELIPTETSAPYTAIVHYAPVFKEGNASKEVVLGENVTLDCSAEGNPPPVIHWNFNSAANLKEATVGRQKIITVTGATSTNAGVYICVATNEVGSLTRSVTLVMKDKTSGVPMALILGLLIVLGIILLLMIMVVFHNRQKKHGQYTFVPDNARNGSNVPMTTRSDVGTA